LPCPPASLTLLQYDGTPFAQYTTPSPAFLSYFIHHTILVTAISCKVCESTAAEAVDDMQRMNVADRMKNGKRPTDGVGATHTKGPHKSGPPHRGLHKAANRRPQRDPNRKHTDIKDKIEHPPPPLTHGPSLTQSRPFLTRTRPHLHRVTEYRVGSTTTHFHPSPVCPLHDIAIANIVSCLAYKRWVGGGVVYCAIVLQ